MTVPTSVHLSFEGKRVDTDCIVFVNGSRLPLFLNYCNHSPTGFEWGYGGSGPAQLAFCILFKYFTANGMNHRMAKARAWSFHQRFKWSVIATLKRDAKWRLTGDQIAAHLQSYTNPPEIQFDQGEPTKEDYTDI